MTTPTPHITGGTPTTPRGPSLEQVRAVHATVLATSHPRRVQALVAALIGTGRRVDDLAALVRRRFLPVPPGRP
ncbi:hypothetical protein [Saccharothrix sp. HUAS TT1]|uniref:hypothetical protein n=1 Tax=unclassified Saccharothrix TaxID=2593673 RepID=UPI00345BDA6B